MWIFDEFHIFFCQITTFSKIYQLKGLEPKIKGHTNFYDHFDFMKKCGITNHKNGDMYVVGYYDLLKMQ